jgi:N-methylhydantoinase B
LRIPPVKLVSAGKRDLGMFEFILTNCRLRDQMRIDLESQVSANRTAIDRVRALHSRYGTSVVEASMDALLNYSERRVREILAGWPDGEYSASDFHDNDGIDDIPREVCVTIRISGSSAVVDFTGSSPQTAGPMNGVLGYTHSGVRMSFQAATDPDIPPNEGCYRPIRIIAPEGSIVNPRFPAACTGGNEATFIVHNTVMRALAKIPGARSMACDQGSSNNLFISGTDPVGGKRYVLYEYPEGGWGGNQDRDGLSAVFSIVGNTWNVPVEAVERRFPIRIERYELRCDSGGAGTHRGGLGVRRDYRVLGHQAEVSFIGNRAKIPPWGLADGGEGAVAGYFFDRGTASEAPASPRFLSKGTMIPLGPDRVLTQESAGGGGWGDPRRRDVDAVMDDVLNGYVSRAAAERLYGVVFDASGAISRVD